MLREQHLLINLCTVRSLKPWNGLRYQHFISGINVFVPQFLHCGPLMKHFQNQSDVYTISGPMSFNGGRIKVAVHARA